MLASPVAHVWRPSRARCVVLDGFAPVPRGTIVSTPSPLSWPAKDPGDVLDYELDFRAALSGNEGDSIASIATLVTPGNAGDLAVTSAVADGPVVVLWMAAGQPGTTYTVQVTVVTGNGRTIGRAVLLPVLPLATSAVPAAALATPQGTVITDQNGNPILIGT